MCIDAGLTAGWAFFRNGQLETSGAWDMRDVVADRESGVGFTHYASRVVMEVTKPHYGKLYEQLAAIESHFQREFPHLERIRASQWKHSHNRAPLPKHCKTQHERDAIRIGLWYLDKHP